MKTPSFRVVLFWSALFCFFHPSGAFAQAVPGQAYSLTIIVLEGSATVAPAGTDNWAPATLNQKLKPRDKIHTEALSRVVLRSSAGGDQEMRERTDLIVKDPRAGSDRPVIQLVRGFLRSFLRGGSFDIDFNNLTAAATRGTEFVTSVDANDRIEITVFDGIVDLTNPQGSVTITNGEQGVAVPGQAPSTSPALNAMNLIQWVLYYPGVLDVDELPWDDATKNQLSASLAAYRSGDLTAALNAYPANRQPATDAEKIYRAALILVVGEVDQATAILDSLAQPSEFNTALRKLIAAVKNEEFTDVTVPRSASAWVAKSYYRQSRLNLEGALAAARAATDASPDFGFAWARAAELEFSFGRVDEALAALEKALALSPRHAGALALKGFLLSAQNKIPAALRQFEEAILVDGALPDAWLGRGLCRIRRGDLAGGREDLRTAAALAPNRAVLRSYLAKAFSDAGDDRHATHELELARRQDVADPTSWLYSALHNQQQNRINEAIRDLERSQELNNNRAVYRSRLLLDQDAAVRSANLAGIYNDAGMIDVSVREAGRAVSMDYANYSAHLFLANSYERLRDPKQINLRYETPAFAEYLVANLLAPVGAGPLSPAVSQQEYSKLFERDRFGVSSRTEYESGGNWFEEGAQYGTFGNMSYAIEGLYRSDNGQRPNNDLEQRQFSAQFKQQITPHDTVYFQATDYRAKNGDVTQYYDQAFANRRVRTLETQEPVVLAGYHHEWSPGHHTLFLGTRLDDTYTVRNPTQQVLLVLRDLDGSIASGFATDVSGGKPSTVNANYESKLAIYSGELQQIAQQPGHTTVLGARFQFGDIDTEVTQNRFADPRFLRPGQSALQYAAEQDFSSDFQRLSLYGYHSWEVIDSLQLIGGIAYDHLTFPQNFRFAPLVEREESTERVSPKGGFIWTPERNTVVRFGYAQGLGGASIDQSFQIEPSQVAGFNQSFRSIIPESIAGANAGARFESVGLSLEHKFPSETYLGLSGELLNSSVRRTIGTLDFDDPLATNATPGHARENLDFSEKSLVLTLNQIVGDGWAFGARYRISYAELDDEFPGALPGSRGQGFKPISRYDSLLHQAALYAIYNHPSGFFAQAQALCYVQNNGGFNAREPGDELLQFNAFAGYRFWRRRAEITVGVLNIGDEDYNLEPLNLYSELPRERTFVARLSFKF
ncbi:MAG TPA: tetratricopeptide repeat protein [Verrucomicrobiae bacterium]|jgi:tetratricopeptide (TPR) repeat protein